MKHLIPIFTYTFSLPLLAAVPLSWTVETTRVSPDTFDVVRGESIALEATFNTAGKPFAMDGYACSIFWQTNGMGSAWWTAPAVATSNRVSATFTPEMDPGGPSVVCFLGSTGQIYRAAFTLRFRHGPGATPNALPLPTPVIDFAKVRVLNPPWSPGGGCVDTNAVREIATEVVAPVAEALDGKVSKSGDRMTGELVVESVVTTPEVQITQGGKLYGAYRVRADGFTGEDEYSPAKFPAGIASTGDRYNAIASQHGFTGWEPDTSDPGAFPATFPNGIGAYGESAYQEGRTHANIRPGMGEQSIAFLSEIPEPLPHLRVYDEVRQCWWIGKMVNGVMQWEVE